MNADSSIGIWNGGGDFQSASGSDFESPRHADRLGVKVGWPDRLMNLNSVAKNHIIPSLILPPLSFHCEQPPPALDRRDDAGADELVPDFHAHIGKGGLAEFFFERRDDVKAHRRATGH